METQSSNNDSNQEDSETIEDKKKKLKEQIDELKFMILQITWSLNTLTFKNINNIFDTNYSDTPMNEDTSEALDIDVRLESELFRYAGFSCVKFSEKEYICNFSPSNRYEKENIFAVQILNKNGECTLGKWTMPMSIHLDDLITEFPLNDVTNIPSFWRTCKHYIDCYFVRREQFNTLMDTVSRTKDCTLQTNLGYTCITLELIGVYYVEDKLYINLILYLIYAIDEARPYKIEVESKTGNQLHSNIKKHLIKSLTCFKKFDLHTAFNNMFNKEPFIWSKEEDEDSPLEISISNSSDEEGFLKMFSLSKVGSLVLGKRRRKRNSNLSKIFENIEQSSSSQSKEETVKNLNRHSMNKESTKIKQTKFRQKNLKINTSELQRKNNMISTKKTAKDKLYEPYTSTPLNEKRNPSKFMAITAIDNISDITVNGDNVYDFNKQSEHTHQTETEDIVPGKVLQSRIEKKVKLLTKPQSTSLKKNSSRKRLKKF